MDRHCAYCSACDREVEVVVRPGFVAEPGAPVPAGALVCLAHGKSCTGALCPLIGVPPKEVADRLADLARKEGQP